MGEVLYNGIELPADWPPRDTNLDSAQPQRVPYLEQPPQVVPIDLGRQLFVDDFLVDAGGTTMTRAFHQPAKHPANPVFFPQSPEELDPAYPPCAVAKCGGVWFDAQDGRFKMWYMTGYLGHLAYATSLDGVHWERPSLDVVPGTNLCLPHDLHPDSGSVVIDHDTPDPATRFKMLLREPNPPGKGTFPGLLLTSPDGIHWSRPLPTGNMDDRSTLFYNPFRKRWVQSIRAWHPVAWRCRHYWEHPEFLASGAWRDGEPLPWCRADSMDHGVDCYPELYNLDAIAYESILLGFHQILRGPPNHVGEACGLPKLTELTVGYSRDGFHWHRPDRRSFLAARREPGSWEYGYVESSAGMCHVVGDELWFYYSAYAGDPRRVGGTWYVNGMYANGAVGLAKLRRDGFASMQARFPGATLQTRPVRFTGRRLFVNANTAGATLAVEVTGLDGKAVPGLAFADCAGFLGNSTCAEVRWRQDDLAAVRDQPVRLRFRLDRGELYAFWVTDAPGGASGGYVGAGGPGFAGPRDTVGKVRATRPA